MSANFSTALKAEIAELEAELRADPRFAKLKHLRDLLALYDAPSARQGATNGGGHDSAEGATKEERVKAELRRYLQNVGGTAHRLAALQHLMELGLMGSEKDPMGNLAAYFSHWKDEFVSDGGGMWSLRH